MLELRRRVSAALSAVLSVAFSVALCGLMSLGGAPAGAATPAGSSARLRDAQPPSDAHRVARWVLQHADHRARPFAIVDKKQARIHVFDGSGALRGASPVLIGLTPGDLDAAPDAGMRPVSTLLLSERTTPAGRFRSEPGRNDKGEAVVWFDYDAALAIHRLRPAPAHERRPQRMASPDPAERRISYGCVVVPGAFFDAVIAPTLGAQRGTVYVLPEHGRLEALLRDTLLDTAAH